MDTDFFSIDLRSISITGAQAGKLDPLCDGYVMNSASGLTLTAGFARFLR